MKLSIVTINRNNASGLTRTLESTFGAQNGFGDWEHIVVDAISTDGSVDVLEKWKDNPHLGWHTSEPDGGIYNAMNKGAAHAIGDYLLFLNSGDELLPDALSAVFAERRTADIFYGELLMATKSGRDDLWTNPPPDEIVPAWFLFRTLPHPATFISRKLFLSMGGYDESYKIVSDAKFFLEAAKSTSIQFERISFPVSKFYPGGISSDQKSERLKEAERERMLTGTFGQDTARCAAKPSEERRWIAAETAEAAKDDAMLALLIRKLSGFAAWTWSFRLTRVSARGLLNTIRMFRRFCQKVLQPGALRTKSADGGET